MPVKEISSEQVSRSLDQRVKYNLRRRGTIPAFMRELEDEFVHIFNISPWKFDIPCGSRGIFVIPACAKGKPYAEMTTPLPVYSPEYYQESSESDKRLDDDGRRIGREVIGSTIDGFPKNANALVYRGVFIAAGEVPTQEELDKAKDYLHRYCNYQINDIRQLWDANSVQARKILQSTKEYAQAAEIVGVSGEAWQQQTAPASSIKCPICRSMIDGDSIKCRVCGEVVNEEAYAALKKKNKKTEV